MALPSFLCIGATKAGTTWLNEQLEQHPDVCMPVVKELHYFSALHAPRHRRWATDAVTKAFRRELRRRRKAQEAGDRSVRPEAAHLREVMALEIFSPAWYSACFDRPGPAGRVTGEITPAYAELPEEGIADVAATLPGVRIIHILRHPVDRALSHLRMAAHRHETPPDEAALLALVESSPQIFSRGAYEEQVPRWQQMIPAERLLYLPFGQVRDTPQQLLARVEDFIGVRHFDGYVSAGQVNTTRGITIPPAVLERVQAGAQPTVDFLKTTFGDEFLQATR